MQAAVLKATLSSLEDLMSGCAPGQTAQLVSDLRDFSALFEGHGRSQVSAFLTKIEKTRPPKANVTSPRLAALQSFFGKCSALLQPLNAKAAADFRALAQFVEGSDHQDMAAFVAEAASWLTPPARTSPKKARKTSAAANKPRVSGPLRADLARKYAEELKAVAEDNDSFDRLMAALKADKSMRTEEMRETARLFLGYEIAKKKRREAAFQEIRNRQARDARQEARGSVIDRLKPW